MKRLIVFELSLNNVVLFGIMFICFFKVKVVIYYRDLFIYC